jgi:hypothetical protein
MARRREGVREGRLNRVLAALDEVKQEIADAGERVL